ncbi:MAG: PAS domain-containing protein [Bryobacteraceae bacterium]
MVIKDIFPADVGERLGANDRAVFAAGKPTAIEEQVPHDDGLHTYISMKFPLEGPDGDIAGVCGIATDITRRCRAPEPSICAIL